MLGFVGAKIMLGHWLQLSPLVSVAVIAALIGTAVWASLRARREDAQRRESQA